MYNTIILSWISVMMFVMDHCSMSTYTYLHIISEVLGAFKYVSPPCYVAKVCVDIPKEYIRIVALSK